MLGTPERGRRMRKPRKRYGREMDDINSFDVGSSFRSLQNLGPAS